MKIEDLTIESAHIKKVSASGAQVIVLNTGAIISPEDVAMLMALHSRSDKGLFGHLERLAKSGSGKMMGDYYVGYGHKSIGDCGATYIFIEGCSMLAAKAIQDFQLYNGQECSTRYIDFGTQPFFTPNKDFAYIAEKMRSFYVESFPFVVEHVSQNNPMDIDESEAMYKKAINARAFDILRGFLPAGATTNVAWHTNLRQAADRLLYLRHHPLTEVKDICAALELALQEAHVFSFGHKRYEGTEKYLEDYISHMNYHPISVDHDEAVLDHNGVDMGLLNKFYNQTLSTRPPKTEIPKSVAVTGALRISFQLDYGSFRDIQRQRAVIQLMPILSTQYGFENWYLEELPGNIKEKASILLEEIQKEIKTQLIDSITAQYVIPMGYKVACVISGDIPAWVYLAELRATRFVHPTLQTKAIQIADILEKTYEQCGLKLHIDRTDIGRFDAGRGKHDITIK
jgi:hypothetical protein